MSDSKTATTITTLAALMASSRGQRRVTPSDIRRVARGERLYTPHQGKKEREKRMRKIAEGKVPSEQLLAQEVFEPNPREKGDDDGVEYSDPRDEREERLD